MLMLFPFITVSFPSFSAQQVNIVVNITPGGIGIKFSPLRQGVDRDHLNDDVGGMIRLAIA